jgi:hypothetical protein
MKIKWRWICLAPALLMVIGFTGCSSTPQPFAYHDDRDEKSGPGLFSGEEGGYVIYGESSEEKSDVKKAPTHSDSK